MSLHEQSQTFILNESFFLNENNIKALKDISVDTCKRGERLIIRDFLIIEGVMTSIKRLPDGKCNTPRLKIKVEVSEALKERFRIEQKELEKLKKPKEDNFD